MIGLRPLPVAHRYFARAVVAGHCRLCQETNDAQARASRPCRRARRASHRSLYHRSQRHRHADAEPSVTAQVDGIVQSVDFQEGRRSVPGSRSSTSTRVPTRTRTPGGGRAGARQRELAHAQTEAERTEAAAQQSDHAAGSRRADHVRGDRRGDAARGSRCASPRRSSISRTPSFARRSAARPAACS